MTDTSYTPQDPFMATFTCFPKLPIELRLKIWKEACLVLLRPMLPSHLENAPEQGAPEDYTTFNCFPELPTELRLKIWEEVCTQARVVDLRIEFLVNAAGTDTSERHDQTHSRTFKYKSDQGVPPILNVCQEAREVGLTQHSPEFGTISIACMDNRILEPPSNSYVNWELDTICPIQPDPDIRTGEEKTAEILYAELGKHKMLDLLLGKMPKNPIEEIIIYMAKEAGGLPARYELGLTRPMVFDPNIAVHINQERWGDQRKAVTAIGFDGDDISNFFTADIKTRGAMMDLAKEFLILSGGGGNYAD